jgi:ribonuclease T2
VNRAALGLLALSVLLALGAFQFINRKSAPPEPAITDESSVAARASPDVPELGKGFDFYVLALSWSPSYCASKGKDADAQQCRLAKPLGFSVHGLWPQFERGYPADCPTDAPQDVSREIITKIKSVMPSASLARYEWRKHGTCSGLSPRDYFDTLLAAFARIRVPDNFRTPSQSMTVEPNTVEAAFVRSNPGLKPAGIAVMCDKRYLGEIRFCLNKDLTFRDCREVDRRACKSRSVEMPPIH